MVATIARIPRPLRMLTGGLLALLAFFALSVAPAAAAPNPCALSSDSPSFTSCLPMDRWMSATETFHSVSSSSWTNPLGGLGVLQREFVAGGLIKAGNFLWGLTSMAVNAATNFSPINSVGKPMNEMAGNLAMSIIDSPVFIGGIVIVLVAIFVQTWRKNAGFPWKQLITKIVLIGLLSTMATAAAGKSFTDGQGTLKDGAIDTSTLDPDQGDTGPDDFPTLSPGWILSTTNSTINAVTGSLAAFQFNLNTGSDADANDPFSCAAYLDSMERLYIEAAAGGGVAGLAETAVPRAISSIWEVTGLQAWQIAQFGTSTKGGVNPFGERVFCRQLDEAAAASPHNKAMVLRGALEQAGYPVPSSLPEWTNMNSIAWAPLSSQTRDISLVGWAVCKPTKDMDGWVMAWDENSPLRADANALINSLDQPDRVQNELTGKGEELGFGKDLQGKSGGRGCGAWWWQGAGKNAYKYNNSPFWSGGSTDDVVDKTQMDDGEGLTIVAQDARTFLNTMHGNATSVSSQLAFGYLISSIVMLCVFGAMSLVVVAAKLVLLCTMFGLLAVMFAAIFIPSDVGVKNLGKFAKMTLGIVLMTSLTALLLSLVASITGIVAKLGQVMFAAAPDWMGMIWTGISPIAALLFVKFIFTNVLKAPNPFSLKGMKGWASMAPALGGAAAGAVGGVVGGGMISRTLSHAASRSTSQAINATTRKMKGAVADHIPGSRKRRSGSAAPVSSASGSPTGPGGSSLGRGKGGSTGPGAGLGDAARAAEALGESARKTNVDALTPPKPWEEMDERERIAWQRQVEEARRKDGKDRLTQEREGMIRAAHESGEKMGKTGARARQHWDAITERSAATDGALHRFRSTYAEISRNRQDLRAGAAIDKGAHLPPRRTVLTRASDAAATAGSMVKAGAARQFQAFRDHPARYAGRATLTAAKVVGKTAVGVGAVSLLGPAALAYPAWKMARSETGNTLLGASRARAAQREAAAQREQDSVDGVNLARHQAAIQREAQEEAESRAAAHAQEQAARQYQEEKEARAQRAERAASPSRSVRRQMYASPTPASARRRPTPGGRP